LNIADGDAFDATDASIIAILPRGVIFVSCLGGNGVNGLTFKSCVTFIKEGTDLVLRRVLVSELSDISIL
jgi:hypothetical protein